MTNDFNQWGGKFQTLLPPGLLLVWCNCGFGVYKPYPFLPGFRLWISFWYGPALDHRQIKYSWSALHWVAFSCVLHGYHKMFFSCLVHLKALALKQCHVTNAAHTVKRSLSRSWILSISKGYEGICVTGSGLDWFSRKTQGQKGILQCNNSKDEKEALSWPSLDTIHAQPLV